MCGLIALRSFDGEDLRARARKGLDAIARRGPDAEGMQCFGDRVPTLLGHRRLSILDLSEAALQPMICPDTGNAVAFNGEIYNFLELRQELRQLGHVFRTESDTEVILQGWRAWGEGLFARCNGMWALVLWERASGDLVFCRDRLGVKPLYLCHDGRRLLLGSEIRSVAAMRGGYPEPNPQAIFDFLVAGVSDHTPATFFQGIRAVPPGWVHRVRLDGHASARSYHRWATACEGPPDAADVASLVTDATHLRLRSDVPTVSLLSGGLDSSILTSISVRAGNLPRTCFAGAFTYGYAEKELSNYDETAPASALMHSLGASALHHVHRARALPDEGELLDLAATQEEPFCTPSILASFRMYRAIRAAGYKVVLSGEGSDELFGGYVRLYLALSARDALKHGQLPTFGRLLGSGAISPALVMKRMAWELPGAVLGPMLRRTRPSIGAMARGLWQSQQSRLEILRDDARLPVDQRMRQDVLATNLPMVLRMTDRNSMRFGLEVRSPFIDYRLVERMLVVPAASRMGDFHGKALLRQAFQDQLPSPVAWQRKSTGFGHAEQFMVDRMPLQASLESLPAWTGEFLDLPRLRREFARGESHSTLWFAASVVLWLRSIYA